jgi:hypothetical protein
VEGAAKDQWLAWWAAWLGWTLDAFDFTVFLPIMVPITQEFNVPLAEVTAVSAGRTPIHTMPRHRLVCFIVQR